MIKEISILVTGASGFVGRNLVDALASHSSLFRVKAVVRSEYTAQFSNVSVVNLGTFTQLTDWSSVLVDVDVVIHLAGLAHTSIKNVVEENERHMATNFKAASNLMLQSASAGVRRFIYLSTAKVNGDFNHTGRPFKPDDVEAPADSYGRSKLEAEKALRKIGTDQGMEWVIIRPPLVYGIGVKANFEKLLKFVEIGVPLPFGLVDNARSMVAVDNLTHLIMLCINHPKAANNVFYVSDGDDISTSVLVKKCAKFMRVRQRLIPVPLFVLYLIAFTIGRLDYYNRLCRSLSVDIQKTKDVLGWSPIISIDDGLKALIAGRDRHDTNI